ncbi:PTS system galactosamine-specific IIB component [Thermoanaerobacterium thermosulfurigenes]
MSSSFTLLGMLFALYKVKSLKERGVEMPVPNILLVRIDNRLVHGQVGVTWTTSLGANLIVVVDDEVAKDPLQQELMAVTAQASGVGIRFFSVDQTINIIHKAAPTQKIFIVCKTPEIVRKLIDGGVPIKEVNVGNMHFSQGKRQISKKVYVDDKDLDELHYIKKKGVNLYIQDVPSDRKEYID